MVLYDKRQGMFSVQEVISRTTSPVLCVRRLLWTEHSWSLSQEVGDIMKEAEEKNPEILETSQLKKLTEDDNRY